MVNTLVCGTSMQEFDSLRTPHFLLITSRKTSFFYKKIYSEEGLCIIHKGPITINYQAKIGKYFRIHSMTTIEKNIGNDNSSPTIENGV